MENYSKSESTPRDVFMHLLASIALYSSAGSFVALLFQYIGILIPDPLQTDSYYTVQSAYATIRWSISTLVIIFPTYILTNWALGKEYARHPQKRNLKIRKWLIYFTLFVAALVVMGDLVTLIFNLLGGEFTTRFVLKVLTIFFVAGSIFYYYFAEVRRHRTE